jgi:hypothetical protein
MTSIPAPRLSICSGRESWRQRLEREVRERNDPEHQRHRDRRLPSPAAPPRPDRQQRQERERVELHGGTGPECERPPARPLVEKEQQGAGDEHGRHQVEACEDDAGEGRRREGERSEHRPPHVACTVEAAQRGAGKDDPDRAEERHLRGEGPEVRARARDGELGKREEGKRAGRVLDVEVPVRNEPVIDRLAPALVAPGVDDLLAAGADDPRGRQRDRGEGGRREHRVRDDHEAEAPHVTECDGSASSRDPTKAYGFLTTAG